MLTKFKVHYDYVITLGTEFAVMASQVLVYKLAAHSFHERGFAEYAVARRVIPLVSTICLSGLGVALPRYVAYASGTGDREQTERYFAATLWSVGAVILFFSVLLNLFQERFAYLFFGQRQYAGLIFAVDLAAAGTAIHVLVYSYFRGQLAFQRANALQFLNLAVVPPLAFTVFSSNVQMVLKSLGLGILAVAGTALFLFTPWRQAIQKSTDEAKELLRYGLRRVPGDFAMVGLVSLPAIVAAHLRGVREAGMVAFGISIANLIAAAVAPVGMILLPKVSRRIGEGRFHEMRREILLIAGISIAVPVCTIIIFKLLGHWLLRFYLGPGFQSGVSIIQILIWGALPLSFYSAMRSVIDAFYRRAVNTGNLVISILVFGACLAIGREILHAGSADLWAFVVATSMLGILTFWELRKILRMENIQEGAKLQEDPDSFAVNLSGRCHEEENEVSALRRSTIEFGSTRGRIKS